MAEHEQQMADFKQILFTYIDNTKGVLRKYVENDEKMSQSLQNLDSICKERLQNFQPAIMFYGIYNAGKSSLLNAMIGKEIAKIGDVPTTDSVDFFDWNGYRIADTPGVNAPMEHQQVTDEQLRKSDVVIFVMSINGAFEYAYNYERMADIINSGKDIIIVLNDKVGYDLGNTVLNNEINAIKQKIAGNMLQVGISNSIKGIEEKYQVILVHAQRAMKGRLSNALEDRVFLEKSNIFELEKAIMRELKKTDGFKILLTVIGYMESELKKAVSVLEKNEKNEGSKALGKLLSGVREQKIIVTGTLSTKIYGSEGQLMSRLINAVWSNREDESKIKTAIAVEIEQFSQNIEKLLIGEIEKSQGILNLQVEELERTVAKLQKKANLKIVACKDKAAERNYSLRENIVNEVPVTSDDIEAEGRKSDIFVGIENIKEILDKMKQILPQLKFPDCDIVKRTSGGTNVAVGNAVIAETAAFAAAEVAKKVGLNTVAGVLGSTVAPIIGPIIIVGSLLLSIFGSDKNKKLDEEMYRRIDAQNEQEKRRIEIEMQARQDLRQNCSEMAYDLVEKMVHIAAEQVAYIYKNLETPFVEAWRIEDEKMNTIKADINAIYDLLDKLNLLKIKIGG